MDFLESLEITFLAAAVVVFFLHKLKVPSLVGFLVAGAVIGPHGAGIIKDAHAVEVLAEIGVVLLLFTIGIELSMTKLLRMRKAVVAGGGLQMVLTIALITAAGLFIVETTGQALFLGFLIALSSTAIVMKALAEKGETDSPQGRIMVGILIFQDLCIVPLMLLTPALAGEGLAVADIAIKMGKAVLIIVVVLLSARWFVPGLLHQVVHTKSRELFITTIIILCMGIALLTSKFGLSLALGAFLAGLIISESEYAHQAMSDILPFKDSFIGLFFVSVGMLIDARFIGGNVLMVVSAVVVIFLLKVTTGFVSSFLIGTPLRTSMYAGLGLAQVGEFSFVLAATGRPSALITDVYYQIFLSAAVITMMITPFVLKAAPSLSAWLTSRQGIKRISGRRSAQEMERISSRKQDHVIIVGFGLNGRNLARVLRETGIPYAILEMNGDTVRDMKKKGEPIYYGDGTSREILHKLGVARAKLLVVAISDPASTRSIVAIARHDNPELNIIVRTRYAAEIDDLRSMGASEIIPEEFETSIEIFSRVLHKYQFPKNVIEDMVDTVRSGSYSALRNVELPRRQLFEHADLASVLEIEAFRIPSVSPLIDRSIGALQIRKKTGATVIAVQRASRVHANPAPDFHFKEADVILYTGDRNSMRSAGAYFREGSDQHES